MVQTGYRENLLQLERSKGAKQGCPGRDPSLEVSKPRLDEALISPSY